MFDHIPTSTDLSREMQFDAQFSDHQELSTFILRHEKLLYIPVDSNLSEERLDNAFEKITSRLSSLNVGFGGRQLDRDTV